MFITVSKFYFVRGVYGIPNTVAKMFCVVSSCFSIKFSNIKISILKKIK